MMPASRNRVWVASPKIRAELERDRVKSSLVALWRVLLASPRLIRRQPRHPRSRSRLLVAAERPADRTVDPRNNFHAASRVGLCRTRTRSTAVVLGYLVVDPNITTPVSRLLEEHSSPTAQDPVVARDALGGVS